MTENKDKKIESELAAADRGRVPILTEGIGTRISAAAKAIGGKRRLADALSISEGQLHRIIGGDNQAKVETIAEIAAATGVSLEWLAIGKGEMIPSDQVQEDHVPFGALLITPESLANALEAVENALKAKKIKLSARKRAKLALLAYEYMKIEKAEEIANEHLRQLIDVASD